jgi:hypothetical protein
VPMFRTGSVCRGYTLAPITCVWHILCSSQAWMVTAGSTAPNFLPAEEHHAFSCWLLECTALCMILFHPVWYKTCPEISTAIQPAACA